MQLIEKKTTNGYTATINPFLTYDQFQDIQDLYTKGVSFDPNAVQTDAEGKEIPAKPKMSDIPMSVLRDANKKAIEFLLVSIKDESGMEVDRKPGELPIPLIDGQEIMDEIDRISKDALDAFNKKKATK